MRNAVLVAAAAVVGLFFRSAVVQAAFGPYTVDSDTLHLWHLDDSAGPAVDAVSTNPLNLTNIDQSAQAANASGGATPATANVTFGNSGFTGFGTAADFSNNALIPSTVNTGSESTSPHRPILLGATALNNADADAVPFTFANPSTGAFTWEAVIRFNGSFNPTVSNYRNGVSGATGGSYPMEIISGEADTNAHRNWQFRIDQPGAGQGVVAATGVGFSGAGRTATGTDITGPRIEFANLHGIGSGTSANEAEAIALPLTGPDAVNNTDWFHIAVEYNGSPNTPNNLSFFWTDLTTKPSATGPDLLGSATMVNSLLQASANNPDFAIGDEARDAGSGAGEGESFVGMIDEVRMSDNTRFAVPEPAAIGLLAVSGMFFRRRQRV